MADDFDRGRQVGKYEILTRISVGGMAELYLAFLPGPGGFKKFVALKQILPDVRRDEQFVKMFLDEARITASLNHPHIGQVFDLGRDGKSGELFLAMEFIAGQDLGQVIKTAVATGTGLPLELSCLIVRDLCLGLHAAHTFVDPSGRAQPVIHRDVAPKNVMVSYAGHVKVIDFGIAKAKGRLVRTQMGTVRGTQAYMSPEQIQDLPIDGRSDLFSVGIILYELLTGSRLYPASSTGSVLKLIRQVPVNPCEQNPEIPAALGEVVLKALAKEPDDRFQTGKAFAKAIEAAYPQLGDEDALAAFMSQLFEAQLKSSRALFEAAQQDADSGQISGRLPALAKRLAPVDEVPELPEVSVPTPVRRPAVLKSANAPTSPARAAVITEPAGTPGVSRAGSLGLPAWALGAAIATVVLVIGAVVWTEAQRPAEPAPSAGPEPAQPISVGPLAAVERGRAALAGKDYPAAASAFDEALALDPKNWTALHGAGVTARRWGHYPAARKWLEQASEEAKSPKDASIATWDLACVLAQLGERDAAMAQLQHAVNLVGLKSFESALGSEPDLSPLRELPAFTRLREGTPEPAPEAGDEAPVAHAPVTLTEASLSRLREAKTELHANRYQRAVVKLEQCVNQQPNAYPCHYLLGRTWSDIADRSGNARDREKSRRFYQRYLDLAPVEDREVQDVTRMLASPH
jgi:serine/threonine protein kinase